MNKIIVHPEIYTFHIDAGRHVSNIVYVQWMEIARIRLLEAIGLPVNAIEQQGYAPVLVQTTIDYKQPLYLGDKVRVELVLTELTAITATMRIDIYREPSTLAATGKQRGLFFDLTTKRARRLSPEDHARFLPYLEAGSL